MNERSFNRKKRTQLNRCNKRKLISRSKMVEPSTCKLINYQIFENWFMIRLTKYEPPTFNLFHTNLKSIDSFNLMFIDE